MGVVAVTVLLSGKSSRQQLGRDFFFFFKAWQDNQFC